MHAKCWEILKNATRRQSCNLRMLYVDVSLNGRPEIVVSGQAKSEWLLLQKAHCNTPEQSLAQWRFNPEFARDSYAESGQ